MGFEDRDYNRDESIYNESVFRGTPYAASRKRGRGGLAGVSIVLILIGINVIVWLLDAFTPVSPDGGRWLSGLLSLRASELWKVWSIVTYGFAHSPIGTNSGIWHIAGNMMILFFLGRPVAERLGRYEFLRFYLSAIAVSGLIYVIWCFAFENGAGGVLGASGACSAVFILFVVWYPTQKLLVWGILPVPAWVLGLGLIGMDFMRAFGGESGVAWQAHLGGAGFAIAYYYFGWHLGWMSGIGDLLPKSKGNLNVYNPDSDSPRASKSDQIKEEGDRILQKISEQGESSLSRKERKTLERYSKEMKNR